MKDNHCTMFPDRWKFIIDFDISFICLLHDQMYGALFPTWTRKDADIILLHGLMRYNNEYHILWGLVYRAVRALGWIPWYLHRIENYIGVRGGKDKWSTVRSKLENVNVFQKG